MEGVTSDHESLLPTVNVFSTDHIEEYFLSQMARPSKTLYYNCSIILHFGVANIYQVDLVLCVIRSY